MNAQDFVAVDVDVQESGSVSITYRSGMGVYREGLIRGQYLGLYWNGAGQYNARNFASQVPTTPGGSALGQPVGAECVPDTHPRAHAFQLEVDGQLLASHWRLDGEVEIDRSVAGKIHVRVRLVHLHRPVSVTVHTLLDGSPLFARWLEIENLADRPAAISRAAPWSGPLLPRSEGRLDLGYFAQVGWGAEGDFRWQPLTGANYRIDGHYRTDAFRQPFFMLRAPTAGMHFVGQLGYSSGYAFEFEVGQFAYFAAHLDGAAPLLVLAPRDVTATPCMHLGVVCGTFDEAIQGMHQHIRRSVLQRPYQEETTGLVGAWSGPHLEMKQENVLQEVDAAERAGAELFWLDALWFSPLGKKWNTTVGSWAHDQERFPDGIEPIRAYVHSKGMKFGLWMEPERVGAETELFHVKPEWFTTRHLEPDPANAPISHAHGWLDLSREDVAAWVEEQVASLIERYHLDFFRLDFNIRPHVSGGYTLRDGYVEDNQWRYNEQSYALWQRLGKRFPNVLMQNCASGGARCDLGFMAPFDNTWVTDRQRMPASCVITNGMSMVLPPERICRNFGMGQHAHMMGDLDTQIRSCILVHPEFAWLQNLSGEENPNVIARVQHGLEIYKTHVRPIHRTCRTFHHTPEAGGQGWYVLELASDSGESAVILLVRLDASAPEEFHLHPRGLQPTLQCRAVFDNSGGVMDSSAFELMRDGIRVRLEAARSSELILISKKENA